MSLTGLTTIDFLLHRNSIQRYQELMESQYYSYEELCHIQNKKLKKIVNHAYNTTRYYRTLMNKLKISPEDIRCQRDLHKLPIVTKEIIRQDPRSFLSSEINNFRPRLVTTGGSTGIPFKYYLSRNFDGYVWGSIWRAWSVGGYDLGDKVAALGGDRISKKSLKHRLYNFLNNWKSINVTDLNDQSLHHIFQNLKTAGCKMIYAYPTPLYLLANYIIKHHLNFKINHIVTTSEVLFSEHRRVIEKAFQCKVFDLYGANDGGVLSFECEYFDGYHLSMEKCITEIVNEKGEEVPNGTTGKVVLTDLENYAMPLIRYEVGDRACITNEPCRCGRGLDRLQSISGRIKDFVDLINGRRIDGSYFTKRFRNISGIVLFQIIQKQSNDVYAKVSISDENDPDTSLHLKQMERRIAKELGIDFYIQVDNLFRRPSNQKFQYIVKE
jgi:phenylacetate-coenzyme A ligase PaaK-like adenylate-forming protein